MYWISGVSGTKLSVGIKIFTEIYIQIIIILQNNRTNNQEKNPSKSNTMDVQNTRIKFNKCYSNETKKFNI